jgi:uncharacterized lipoprotein YmbA
MKRLMLILISCLAGCSSSQAVNPYAVGTPEQQQRQLDYQARQTRRRFMFEGHDLPETTTPPGSVPRHERD